MFCFINLTPQTPPSVIHGWKATDLLYEMVKTKKIFFHPVKRQIFDDAPKQTFYMISKLVVFGRYSSQRLLISEWSKTTKRSTTMNSFHFPFSLQGRKVLPRPLKDGLRALLPFLLGSASLSPPSCSSCRSTSPSSSSPCSSLLLQLL